MLDDLLELFYDPWIFWGVPLLLAVVMELFRGWRHATNVRADHDLPTTNSRE